MSYLTRNYGLDVRGTVVFVVTFYYAVILTGRTGVLLARPSVRPFVLYGSIIRN